MATLNTTINALLSSGISSQMLNTAKNTVDDRHIENMPISGDLIRSGNKKIIIKPELVEKLAYIKSTIDRQKGTGTIEELPFAMIGEKDNNGNIIINDIIFEKTKFENRLEEAIPGSLDTAVATFDGELSRQMSNYLQNKNIKNPVVIHGHTHPQHLGVDSRLTSNFSLGDINAYQQFEESVKSVNPNAETYGMVINEFGDFNTVGFDTQSKKFEKIDNVFLGQDKLPSFSKGNYFSSLGKNESEQHTAQHQEMTIKDEPKIEPVSFAEIQQTGYYNRQPTKPIIPKQKKSWFENFIEKVGKIFTGSSSMDLQKPKIYQPTRHSIAKPPSFFKNKLEALKKQSNIQMGIE